MPDFNYNYNYYYSCTAALRCTAINIPYRVVVSYSTTLLVIFESTVIYVRKMTSFLVILSMGCHLIDRKLKKKKEEVSRRTIRRYTCYCQPDHFFHFVTQLLETVTIKVAQNVSVNVKES